MEKMELELLARRHVDRLKLAIRSGDTVEALHLLQETVDAKKGFHDFMVKWANMLLRRIGDLGGDEAVFDAHREMAQAFRPPVVANWEAAGAERGKFPMEEFIRQRCIMWQLTHDNELEIEEDEEKFTLTLKPCESGGRLMMWFDGNNPSRTKEKHQITYFREGFQYYCAHCGSMWEFGWYEQHGWPLIIYSPPEKPGEPCVQTLYKDPRNIPDQYYERTGLIRKW